ncbi:crinkler family protein: PROVISIONAL [Gigaspora margarita]|uniref:Crinkler family protein: PROVISIONAL n=1 Tax=Gigaspora margarita TaxID=4874 RepID=A0A8H4AET0_GIGMA|nr:crinkler family protein: PROVISIONAL [Gigaspora margarita]
MPTLYCLVHGDPVSSVFGIEYDKNMTVDGLRRVIWKEVGAPEHVIAKDLLLYQVNIDLTTQNPQRNVLGNPDANIVTDLGGQLLSPIDNVEEKFPAPVNKHVHIIVDLPTDALPVAARRNDDIIIATLDRIVRNVDRIVQNVDKLDQNVDKLDQNVDRIDKNIEDIKKEKTSVHISGVTEGYWMKIQESLDIDYESTTRKSEFPNLDLDLNNERIDAFRWMDATERSQSDRYKPHLTNILRLGTFRTLGLYDPTGDDSFLSTNTDILPIRLSGTTDVVIVDRHSIASRAQEKHIRVLFELKKAVNRKHTFQTMAELISADLKSKHPVLAVLTDLIDDWNFFWIKGKIIMRLTLSRVEAVALIRHNLTSANNELRDIESSFSEKESSFSEEEPLPKRQKLRHVIATSNVSSDIAPMEDFFDTMNEEEIFRYKAKKLLTRFFSQPIFNGMNDQAE